MCKDNLVKKAAWKFKFLCSRCHDYTSSLSSSLQLLQQILSGGKKSILWKQIPKPHVERLLTKFQRPLKDRTQDGVTSARFPLGWWSKPRRFVKQKDVKNRIRRNWRPPASGCSVMERRSAVIRPTLLSRLQGQRMTYLLLKSKNYLIKLNYEWVFAPITKRFKINTHLKRISFFFKVQEVTTSQTLSFLSIPWQLQRSEWEIRD